jgi:hypothetical protein
MAASETYTTPADWQDNSLINAAFCNPQIRDNIAYLKGVLSGSDKQDVVVHANKALKHGALQVMRGPDANKNHMCFGTITSGQSATFTLAFSQNPVIVTSGTVATDYWAASISTTGFTAQASNAGTSHYVAVGRS